MQSATLSPARQWSPSIYLGMRLNIGWHQLVWGGMLSVCSWSCFRAEPPAPTLESPLPRILARAAEVDPAKVQAPLVRPAQLKQAIKTKVGQPVVTNSTALSTLAPTNHTQLLQLEQLPRSRPGKGNILPATISTPRAEKTALSMPEVLVAKDLASKERNPYNFSAFGKLQGLKHGIISAIIQDSKGNLWLGTQGGGLCRFDGKYFTHYTDQQGLRNNSITSILEDPTGNLWLGTDGNGLCKFDGKTFIHYDRGTALEGATITSMVRDAANHLWIGTIDRGLFRFDGRNFFQFGPQQGLAANEVLSLAFDQAQRLWIGHLNVGLSIFDQTSFLHLTPSQGWPYSDVYCLASAPNGDLWIGGETGASRFSGSSVQHFSLNHSIASISINHTGDIWLGTFDTGVIRYRQQRFELFAAEQGLNNPSVLCLLEDASGNFWLGTDGGGLSKFQGQTFSHLSTQEGLSHNEVFSIIEDRQGQLYFGTAGGGLVRFDGQKFYQFNQTNGLPHNFIYCMLQDRRGNLWLGTNGQGVVRYDGEFFTQISEKDGLSNNTVLSILEDRRGRLWFGTRGGGATCYDGQNFWHFGPDQGLTSSVVFALAEDHQGQIWLGTQDGGLSCWDGQRLRHYRTDQGLSHNSVSALVCDQAGHLWIGTLGGGLNHFDGQYFTHLTEKNGLTNNAVLSLLQDKKGDLWVGTRFGLAQLPAAKLAFFNQPKPSQRPAQLGSLFQQYTYNDGFLGIGCWRNSLCATRNGDLYIGANDRLTIHHPTAPAKTSNSPHLELMELLIYNQSVPWSQLQQNQDSTFWLSNGVKLRDFRFKQLSAWHLQPQALSLKYFNNNLNFRLLGITQHQPEKITYQFKLEGLDDTWTSRSLTNEATYGNLAPGTYTLRARAFNSAGASSNELSYSFQIRPPWWRSYWMYAIYILLALGLLVRWRRQELRRQNQALQLERRKTEQEQQINEQLRLVDELKDQFLANTSHELRTPLQGIIGLSESLLERVTDPAQKEVLAMVISSGRRLHGLVNEILDFSKLKNHEITLVTSAVSLYALVDVVLRTLSPLIKGKNLQLINAIEREYPPVKGDENRILQILYNLIGNAIKFSERGYVKIFATPDPSAPAVVRIAVEDTGIGVPADKREVIFQAFEQADGTTARSFAGTGLGLSVSKRLVELHGGQMWLESEVGQGSTFFFTLPMAPAELLLVPAPASSPLITPLSVAPPMATELPLPQESTAEQGSIHLLLVDDEPVNLQVYKNFLQSEGFRITSALSGEEALHLIATDGSLDLVLLDVMMPRMSGYEVCQKIREKHTPDQLPVIMITAKNQVSDLVLGLNAGANDYIAKPFSKDEFLARLHTHLNLYRINAATQRFVPSEFLRSLGHENISAVRLGDHVEQVVTVMFADIRNYTGLSESMSPEENFRFVSAYHQRVGPLIQKNNGFINQYLGDGIMAIFPGNPLEAIQAAIDLQTEIEEYNHGRQQKQRRTISVGVGLHTGPLIMGIIGDEKRLDAATVADTVNIASRLEGLTKYYGARILLSEDTWRSLPTEGPFHLRRLGRVQVKGKQSSTEIFECYDGDSPPVRAIKRQHAALFDEGLQAYLNRDFALAVNCFARITVANIGDHPANLFLEKSRNLANSGAPSDWSGTELMKEK